MRHSLARTQLLSLQECQACRRLHIRHTIHVITSSIGWQRTQAQPFLLLLSFLSLAFFFLWLLLAASEDSYSTE